MKTIKTFVRSFFFLFFFFLFFFGENAQRFEAGQRMYAKIPLTDI